jgi:hypothetical protein
MVKMLDIFIGEHLLKGAAMQIELDHIGRLQAAGGMGGQEQFVDVLSQLFTDGHLFPISRCCSFGDNHATVQLVLKQGLQPIREVAHLIDFSPHAGFRVN